MNINEETLLQLVADISSTKANVERILDTLDRGDKEFEKIYRLNELLDAKLQLKCTEIEQQIAKVKAVQDVLTGKFSVLWMLIGGAVTAVANLTFYLWNRKG
jgi:hypothetical protein